MAVGKPSRREVLAGAGAALAGGTAWAHLLAVESRAAPFALRPPGAIAEADFLATCIRCGQCVASCPYRTLRLAAVGSEVPIGTPHFVAREVPCRLCPDLPCTRNCPTGALSPALTDARKADMGLAVVVDQENCLSYRGLRCEICVRTCPLGERAMRIHNLPRGTSKHALFVPVVRSDGCTGCGMCEHACPLPEPAIRVLPRTLAQARPGEHYRFGEGVVPGGAGLVPPSGTEPEGASELDYLNEDVR